MNCKVQLREVKNISLYLSVFGQKIEAIYWIIRGCRGFIYII